MIHSLCFVIHSLQAGGAERVMTNLANKLQSEGTKVTFLLLDHTNSQPAYELNKGITVRVLSTPAPTINKVFFQKIYMLFHRLFWLRFQFSILKPEAIVSFIDKTNISVIAASVGKKIPVIVSERIDPNYHRASKVTAVLRRLFYPWAHNVVVQTESAKKFFSWLNQEKLCVIPNPILNNVNPKNTWRKKPIALVTIGRLCEQKDQKTLIKAFASLHKKNQNLTLDIYGEGPLRNTLGKLVTKLDLNRSVNFRGVSNEISNTLRSYDIFVFPSLYEGFPNALAEAMAIGLPVIASDCTGNRDLIKDGYNALTFTPGKTLELTEKIELSLANQPLCIKIGQNAKKITARYSIDKIANLWKKAIND